MFVAASNDCLWATSCLGSCSWMKAWHTSYVHNKTLVLVNQFFRLKDNHEAIRSWMKAIEDIGSSYSECFLFCWHFWIDMCSHCVMIIPISFLRNFNSNYNQPLFCELHGFQLKLLKSSFHSSSGSINKSNARDLIWTE